MIDLKFSKLQYKRMQMALLIHYHLIKTYFVILLLTPSKTERCEYDRRIS